MRYLKKLLLAVYIYLAIFGAICLILWAFLREEPQALIAGVFGAAGVESIIGGLMKLNEIKSESKSLQDRSEEHDSAAKTQRDDIQ